MSIPSSQDNGSSHVTGQLPPPTVESPVPSLLRPRRDGPTTTHAQPGGGRPRLVLLPGPHPGRDDQPSTFALGEETLIGSGEDCDVRLPGLAERHAQVWRDERDEYVLVRLTEAGDTTVNGAPVDTAVLRTATRIEMGEWTLSFYREEYADHGRPHGGRQGGELGHQQPQAPRAASGSSGTGDWSGEGRPSSLRRPDQPAG